MDYTIENVSPVKKKVRVKIEKETFEKKMEEITKEIQKNIAIRGFRRGKVPIPIIKAQYGEAIKRETVEEIVRETLGEILEKENLSPVSQPVLEEMETDREVNYTVSFEVLPDFEPKGYQKIKVKIKKETVDEEDVENALNDLRYKNSVLEPIEDRNTVREGDVVLVELLSQRRKAYFKVEKGDEFDGKDKGEVVELEGEKGKILNIYNQIIPDLNEDFAKTLGTENVDQLIEKVREELEKKAEQETRTRKMTAIFETLFKENPFPVPASLVEDEYRDLKKRLRIEEDNKELKKVAEKRVREEILIFAIAKKEHIQAEEREIEEELEKIAQSLKKRVEEIKAKAPELKRRVENNIIRKKVLEMLENNAEVSYE